MNKLKNRQAIRNLIGKKTILQLELGCDSILTYKTTVPHKINEEFYNFTVEVFYTALDTFMAHERLEDILLLKPFRVAAVSLDGLETKELYLKKFDEPEEL